MPYLLLAAAVLCGVSGTVLTKLSGGFRRWAPSAGALAAYAGATFLLSQLVRVLQVGVVYAVWSGIAAIALLLIDRLFFGERLRWRHGAGVALVVGGIVLINSGPVR